MKKNKQIVLFILIFIVIPVFTPILYAAVPFPLQALFIDQGLMIVLFVGIAMGAKRIYQNKDRKN